MGKRGWALLLAVLAMLLTLVTPENQSFIPKLGLGGVARG